MIKNKLLEQKGQSTIYIVIILVVIIFAVMLTGGTRSLLSGDTASTVTNTPTPPGGALPTATSAPPSPTNSPGWDVTVSISSCKSGKSPYVDGTITVKGASSGTVRLEIDDSGFTKVAEQNFTPPNGTFPIILRNDAGFNTKNWRVLIISGGTTKGTYQGTPTGC